MALTRLGMFLLMYISGFLIIQSNCSGMDCSRDRQTDRQDTQTAHRSKYGWWHLCTAALPTAKTTNLTTNNMTIICNWNNQNNKVNHLLNSCLSVRPSVTLLDQDHIGWKSWKLIARTISQKLLISIFCLSNRTPKITQILTLYQANVPTLTSTVFAARC